MKPLAPDAGDRTLGDVDAELILNSGLLKAVAVEGSTPAGQKEVTFFSQSIGRLAGPTGSAQLRVAWPRPRKYAVDGSAVFNSIRVLHT
ncbi:hypothetical protein MCOR02_006612 [Pyricularia oryzae]|nr:hypothetical protein MCOR02_006612 [Pyricularia oryzae]KAI6307276.1 hypothetical protein MCOR34_007685 [Pyricularia oryzae]KAI6586270.1 hypothetical protein MCOR04_004523 [Pyricularia oryzae]